MDGIWKTAIKIGGVISVGLYVFWSLAKDMIPKFSVLNSFQTLVLAGFMLFLMFIIILKLIKKETPKVEEIVHENSTNERNSSVTITGSNSSGTIVTGDGNSVNSEKEPTLNSKEQGNRDSSVSIGGNSSGTIITGDENSIK